jgi:5-methylcytosine-specific restriction protein A
MFIVGKEYLRKELLDFVGSRQTQVGIIWGKRESGCVICTTGGRHSQQAGYHDKRNDDGTWDYFGQGQVGNQNPKSYSNRILVSGEKSVLLFSTQEPTSKEIIMRKKSSMKQPYAKRYTFQGIYNVGCWDIYVPIKGTRKGNKLLKFDLYPDDDTKDEQVDSCLGQRESSLIELRKQALEKNGKPCKGKVSSREYKKTSKAIKVYARARAKGVCERCENNAPFKSIEGPFLEVHHLLRLADSGPDKPENVAAICPNCHSEAHYGLNRNQIRKNMISIIQEKELEIVNSTK